MNEEKPDAQPPSWQQPKPKRSTAYAVVKGVLLLVLVVVGLVLGTCGLIFASGIR